MSYYHPLKFFRELGRFRSWLVRWGGRMIALAIWHKLYVEDTEAKNYIETQFMNFRGERLAIAVVKDGGLTPHELRMRAEEKVKVLEDTIKTWGKA